MGWGGYNLVSLEVNEWLSYWGRIKTLALPLGKGQGKKFLKKFGFGNDPPPPLWKISKQKQIFFRMASLRLYNSAGRTSKGPKFCGAKLDCKFAPRSFRAFEVRPVELWSLRSGPRRVLEQCNVCPAFSWRHSYGGQNTHKNHLKIKLKVLFVNHWNFKDLYNQYDIFFQTKIFHKMVPLLGGPQMFA